MPDFDSIVIGSGMGGMTAALYLAQAGHRVALLEAGKQFGGYMNPFARKQFHFDVGLHYVGECGPEQSFQRILEQLHLQDKLRFRELNPDGFDRYVFPGYEVSLCKGRARFRDRLVQDFRHETAGLDRFFALMRSCGQLLHSLSKEQPFPSFPSFPSFPGMADMAPTSPRLLRATFADLIHPLIKDPLLRAVLAAPCGDIGLPPKRISGILHLLVMNHSLMGGYYPVGGSGAIRDVFIDELQRLGADLRRPTQVSRILLHNSTACGVRLASGEVLTAKSVVSNVHATLTFGELLAQEEVAGKLLCKIRKTENSLASLLVYIATGMDLPRFGLTDANIRHYEDLDIDAMYEPLFAGQFPEKGGVFITVPTLKDPDGRRAPPGVHTLELIQLVPYSPFKRWAGTPTLQRPADYTAFKERLGRSVLDLIERRYLPGLSKQLLHFEVSTPLTNVAYTLAPEGAIYGPAHTPDLVGPCRFPTRTPIKGLYLCGASVLGAGVVACAVSGKRAAQTILKADNRCWLGK